MCLEGTAAQSAHYPEWLACDICNDEGTGGSSGICHSYSFDR